MSRLLPLASLLAMSLVATPACETPAPPESPESSGQVAIVGLGLLGDANDPHLLTAPATRTNLAAAASTSRFARLTVPNNATGLRVAVRSTQPVTVYVRRDGPTGPVQSSTSAQTLSTFFFTAAQATADNNWWVEVISGTTAGTFDLQAEPTYAVDLTWDDGNTLAGTAVASRPANHFGDQLYRITARAARYGAWRSVLRVTAGEASLALGTSGIPNDFTSYGSANPGSDAFVLAQPEFTDNQVWWLRVRAETGTANWNLVSGDIHVVDLGALTNDSALVNLPLDVGQTAWFKTEATANTLAWRLSTTAAATLRINDTAAPVPRYSSTWDLMHEDEALVVPTYLKSQGYIVAVTAASTSATSIGLINRNHRVIDPTQHPDGNGNAFAFSIDETDQDGFGFVTFKVQVPVQQIAWQVTATPTFGEVDLFVGKGRVANQGDNDGLSAVLAVTDSVTFVPPTLTNGTFYVTVRGEAPFSFTLTSGNPTITPLDFVDTVQNGLAYSDQVGWRYFIVDDTTSQVGALGWLLELSNHVPGTEIAIRRNGVPGRWNYRTWPYGGLNETNHLDHSSTFGFLERPNHPADIWYIGIYQPTAALGNFTLTTSTLQATDLPFHNGVATVANQRSGRWRYFRVNVPETTQGWDLRIDNVTGGRPKMTVRAELVPGAHGDNPWYLYSGTTWSSGWQWSPTGDLTQRNYRYVSEALPSVDESGRHLLSGLGNPLRSGFFYIGVSDTWTTTDPSQPLTYRITSRGIGDGGTNSIPITDLPFTGGSATVSNLSPREIRAYRVQVPAGVESFGLELQPTVGEAMMAVRKGGLPNHQANSNSDSSVGARRQKNGYELFYRYPDYNETTLAAGSYYVVVGAEGAATSNDGQIRGGTTSFTLTSRGEMPVLGNTELTADAPLAFNDQSLRYGEQRLYRFTVPEGLSSAEVRLNRRGGNPWFSVSRDNPIPTPYSQSYTAAEGGGAQVAADDDIVTLQAPSGTYTILVTSLSVSGQTPETGALFDLVIEGRGESTIDFNGGLASVIEQASQTWRYFRVDVPEGALGWDLRLVNIAGGRPRMVIRRDTLPDSFSTTPGCCPPMQHRETWDTGWMWAPSGELTQRNYAFYNQVTYTGGEDEYGRSVTMGMNNPLLPGTYYIGVSDLYQAATGSPMTYELWSRGIGIGNDANTQPWSIQVADLEFNGNATATLDPREQAYYRVVVPPETKSWEVELTPSVGEAMMAIKRGDLPNADAGSWNNTTDAGSGTSRRKTGIEHFYRYPEYSETYIPSGTYYIGVGAEGQNAYSSSYIGEGPTTFTLHSRGEVEPLIAESPLGETPIRWNGQTLRYGEQQIYRFEVPAGTLSMEVRLENKTGNPYLAIGQTEFPTPTQHYVASLGGQAALNSSNTLLTLTEPQGSYTVIVTGYHTTGEPPATFDLVVQAVGETPLAFNGGEIAVEDHLSNTWRYFRVNVPAGALGWDLRLEDVTEGSPKMVIRRDELPDYYQTNPGCCPGVAGRGTWETGWSWAPAGELTQRNYSYYDQVTYTGGQDESGRRVSMGMDNPLVPGAYIIGITSPYVSTSTPMSYRIVSRGIGIGNDANNTPWHIQVRDLSFGETVEVADLEPRDHVYYRLTVPEGMESWSAELEPVIGEAMMSIRKGALPNSEASGYSSDDAYYRYGVKRQKDGREWFYKLPWYDTRPGAPGTYYIGVGAEGTGAYSSSYIGQGPSGFRLTTRGPIPVEGDTGIVVESTPHIFDEQTLAWGEHKYYRLRVPPTVQAFEVRLANRIGVPYFSTTVEPYFDPKMPSGSNYSYPSAEGGWSPDGQNDIAQSIVGSTGDVTIGVYSYGGTPVANGYDLVVTPQPVTPLPWDGGEVTVVLKDRETTYFKVEVPQDCDGVAQAGWIVSQDLVRGSVALEVRKSFLPGDPRGTTQTLNTSARETVIVPPFLEPGTWYIAARATGSSEAIIRTREVREERLWTMPRRNVNATTPGLTHPFFADTGIDDNGQLIVNQGSGDPGVDLGEGRYRFYRVTVPEGNGGLFRTRLDAISGDPELFIRRGAAPTLSQMPWPYYNLTDYSDTRDGSSYGHWVAVDSRYGTELTPGEYWIAVYAQGSNVRYRLTLDVGVVQDLALRGGTVSGHALAAGDMRFYRVHIPQTTVAANGSTPLDWLLTLTQQSGDAVVLLREGVPPGLYSSVVEPSQADYYLRDWNGDRSAYTYDLSTFPKIESTGTTTLSMPWIRPNTTYWLGVYARTDVVYDLASNASANTETIDEVLSWPNGTISRNFAPNESRLYRVDVPANAGRWLHEATVADGVRIDLSVGFIPPTNNRADFTNSNYGASYYNTLDRNLDAPGGYIGNFPWVPGESYFLLITNTTATTQPVAFELDGRSGNDDSDNDGLLDGWEYRFFGNLYYDGASDNDSDGLPNSQEQTLTTNPTLRDTDDDDLDDLAELFAGGDPLVPDTDDDEVCDGSDSAPDDPNEAGPVIRLMMHQWTEGEYGKNFGSSQHETRLVAVFDRYQVKSHWIHITGYDIESADEVAVFLNGTLLGHLPVGGNNVASMPGLYFIPSDSLISSTLNRLELRQKTRGETWGVKDLGLFTWGQTFGYDATRAYDTRHPNGFDIYAAGFADQLIEMTVFDIEAPDEVSIAVDKVATPAPRAWLDELPTTTNNGWAPHHLVPVLASDFGEGVTVVRVRKNGGDGNWQVRLVDTYALLSQFGNEQNAGLDGAFRDDFRFLFPTASELRELVVQYRVSDGESVNISATNQAPATWPGVNYWQWGPNDFFFSDTTAQERVHLARMPSEPPATSPSFNVGVRYYGPCIDYDNSGVADCEEVCEDLDEDGADGRSDLCGTGTDCDDTDPEVGASDGDADCDGVSSELDCNDNDAGVGSSVGDADCDGVPVALDCNDNDPSNTTTNADDGDCDGIPTALDCDDTNASNVISTADDGDCDGVPTTADCNDDDPGVTASNVGDADCDAVPTGVDCDDTNAAVTATNSNDADCDGVATGLDCDDANAGVTTTNTNDADCDGVATSADCDDNNAAVTTTSAGDADCDGVATAADCDDTNPAVTNSNVGDADCDGVPSGLDCDDGNPTITGAPDANDRDCDGVPTPIDCNDADRTDTRSRVDDADCDGVAKAVDCDDADPSDTRQNVGDLDCDGVPSAEDCDDTNASDTRSRVGDADCDGAATADDCDDNDPLVQTCPVCVDVDEDGHFARTAECAAGNDCDDGDKLSTTVDVDADCDGVPTDDDCDDEDDASFVVADDADCDGVPTDDDCDDEDPLLGTRADDADCDGVPSERDNCPSVENADQLDTDLNGVGDACDECVGDDGDGDFVVDVCDVCPDVPDDQADTDDDGVGDACEDGDGDGVYDEADNCPGLSNADQADADRDGVGDLCDEPVIIATESSGCSTSALPTMLFGLLLLGLIWLRSRARLRT